MNMPMPPQDSISRISGLELALRITLRELAAKTGKDARATIEALRDEAIKSFKNSGIPANREMEHAKIVGPSIEVIETVFDEVLRGL
jgi:hypothetical protein